MEYIQRGDIHGEGIYTDTWNGGHRVGTHTGRGHTWGGDTHGDGIYTEMRHIRREDICGVRTHTYTWNRDTYGEEIYTKRGHTRRKDTHGHMEWRTWSGDTHKEETHKHMEWGYT